MSAKPTTSHLKTLREHLELLGIVLDKPQLHKLATLVSRHYRQNGSEPLLQVYRQNEQGKSIKAGNGYPLSYSSVIVALLKQL